MIIKLDRNRKGRGDIKAEPLSNARKHMKETNFYIKAQDLSVVTNTISFPQSDGHT